jgi:hypothetical protein
MSPGTTEPCWCRHLDVHVVVARTGSYRVLVVTRLDEVPVAGTGKGVVTCCPVEPVGACAANGGVVAVPGLQHVVPQTATQQVAPPVAIGVVVVAPATQLVGALAAEEVVVTVTTREQVMAAKPADRVPAVGPVQVSAPFVPSMTAA